MSNNDGCIWCDAYAYATETLGYSEDAAANYATLYEANATKS
jgi:hypothetical protein